VTSTAGEALVAPATIAWLPPVELAEARARLAIAGDLVSGDFEVPATLRLGGGTVARLQARVEPDRDASASGGGRWRFSVGVHTDSGEVAYRHEVIDAASASVVPEAKDLEAPATEPVEGGTPEEIAGDGARAGAVHWTIDLELPPGTDGALVLAHDLETGSWGFGRPEFVLPDRDPRSNLQLQRERLLQLEPIAPGVLTGTVTIRAVTASEVDRVEFLLNGERVARRSRPPFETEIELGDVERLQQVVVVAYDRRNNEIDRDRLVINEPPTSFWVRFVEPEPGSRAAGPTMVEAEVRVPRGGELRALDLFWKDRRLARLSGEPFRTEVNIPLGDPEGFLRAEAVLADGRTAEDVLVVSRSGFGEQIGVDLVELYVVVTDRGERPIRGLEREDFTVIEDSREQVIEAFEVAGDLPLTLGLAIDSSSSLFVRMPAVKRAASQFVDILQAGRDRAFLVDFGSEPRLVTPITTSLARVKDGIRSLEPFGSTAVWGALALSLEQLEAMRGRRALVVFYDGDDEDEEARFREGLRLARRARVPIYMILVNNEAARSDGRSLSSRAFVGRLDRIARSGGGKVYYVSTHQDLEPIFEAIAEELRSHYLLTYYPIFEPGGPLWRPVSVEVERRGLSARTIEGRGIE
jgi:Ca-activated chloride channel family protein